MKTNQFLLPLLSCVSVVLFGFWFYSLPSVAGLLHWESYYKNMFFKILSVIFIPLIFFAAANLFLFLKLHSMQKVFFALSNGFSVLIVAAVCVGFVGLSFFGTYKPSQNTKLNILPVDNQKEFAKLAFSSDPHWGKKTSNVTARNSIMQNVQKNNYDAFFILGDIAEVGVVPNIYETASKDIAAQIQTVPVRLLMGNHDPFFNAQRKFINYFIAPADKKPYESGNPLYYRINSGKIHLLILNLLWGTETFTKNQKEWLINQLKNIPRSETVIVLSHSFYVSSGFTSDSPSSWYDLPDMIAQMCPIFEQYGVDLVISGHNHHMEYLQKNGVSYAIIGTMGGKSDSNATYISPYSVWYKNGEFGFIQTLFNSNTIELSFKNQNGDDLYTTSIKTD